MRFLPIVVVFLVLVTELSYGQSFYAIRRERSLIATVGTGSANYFGELVNPGTLGKIRPNLVVGAEYYFFNRVSARAELTWFMIAGDDKNANSDRVERNLNFFSNNLELSATGAVYLLPNGVRFYQRPILNVYGFGGIALLYFNPKTRYQGDVVALAPLETEGTKYSRVIPTIPFGIGVKIKYGPFFNILLEGGYRLTFTDHLDDVSIERYPDPASLKSNLSRALSDRRRERDPDYPIVPGLGKRGNPDTNDGYILLNVKVQYYLPIDFRDSQRKLYNRKRKQYNRMK